MNARRMFDALVQKRGIALKPKLEINEIHTLLHLVRTDRWVAILVDSIIHGETGLCAVPFREAALPMPVVWLYQCDKASFCVIEQDDVQPKKYITFFRSVIAFGRIHIIEDEQEKLETARMLGNRYNPNDEESLQKEIESGFSRMLMIRFDIEHLTGKEAIELVGMRNARG